MNNYPSQTLPPIYPYPIIRQYTSQPYCYSFDEYSSSPLLPHMPYTNTILPREQYRSLIKSYDDDEESYFSEYHHYRHRPNSNKQNTIRVRNISSQSQQKSTLHQEKTNNNVKNSINENGNRESSILKPDIKRSSNGLYKPLNHIEFLAKTQAEIRQEYRKIPNPPAKDTHAAKEERNLGKSRYRDVIPGEATRVKLQSDGDEKSDFINANYVSGHNNQEKAYIFTQGPLESTVKDFWRMIWQENISVIVMTTNIRESNTMKCFQYWPGETKTIQNTGLYQIQNEKSEKFDSFTITTLILRKKNHPDARIIYHAHYLKWPDHGIPSNTKDALAFLEHVDYYRKLTKTEAPILLHCSAGIGRTGTFCAIDIGIKRYLDKKSIDIPSTVAKMRTERAGSVQTEDQYLFAYLALMDYVKQQIELEERIAQTIKTSDIDLIDTNDEAKIKDKNGLYEIDDNIRKTTRTKKHGKKSYEVGQTNTFPTVNSIKNTNLQETKSQRGKTLSDSCTSAVQYLTPSTTVLQTESNHQRSSTEQISSMPTTTGNVNHKKARK